MHVMRAVLPVMRKQRSGRIINVSSLAGIVGFKHCGAYSAAKFAVEGLSASVAHEVEPFGIKIVAVEPGFFRTDLLDAQHAKYAGSTIEDYAAEGKAEAMWSGYDGKQQGDPAKLGDVLVKIAGMEIHQGNSWPAAMRLRWSSRRSKPALRNCEHTRICPSRQMVRSEVGGRVDAPSMSLPVRA